MDLYNKYRPNNLDQVIGQEQAVKSLKKVVEEDSAHALILTGPSGVGKTTIARIFAHAVGCDENGIIEIDGASNTGVENMRQISQSAQYKTIGKSPNKAVIVDEFHQISRASWNSLLKSIEEPPEHVYWIFLTTESEKVPDTIRTRCISYELKSIHPDVIFERLVDISEEEELVISDEVLSIAADYAEGSMRQAIVNLNKIKDLDEKEAKKAITSSDYSADFKNFARYILSESENLSWQQIMQQLEKLDMSDPESFRLQVIGYFSSVAKKAKTDEDLGMALRVLDEFSTPFNNRDKIAPILVALGRLYFDE